MVFRIFFEKTAKKTIRELKSQVSQLKKSLKDSRKQVSDVSGILTETRGKLEDAEAEVSQLNETVKSLADQNERFESSVDLLSVERDTLLQQVETYLKLRRVENIAAALTESRILQDVDTSGEPNAS